MPYEGATLYAGYEKLVYVQVTYAVNMASAGTADPELPNGFVRYRVVEQLQDTALAYPADPVVDGYVFEGWFTEPELKYPCSYRIVPLHGVTLYGKFTRLAPGGRYRAVAGGVELVSYQPEEDADTELHLPSVVNGQPVVSIAAGAFESGGVDRLYLPDTLVSISPDAFKDSGIMSVNIGKGSSRFTSQSGVLYDKDVTRLIYYPAEKRNTAFTMPDTVTVVGAHAVEGNPYLQEVHFSDALTEIGQEAFSGCTALRNVTLPDTCTVLRAGAFSGCIAIGTFTAYGLQSIEGTVINPGEEGSVNGQKKETIPRFTGISVYGPAASGALRDWFTFILSDGTRIVLQYNQYPLTLHLDGETESLSSEAGMLLNRDIMEVTFDDGSFVEAWYTDAEMTQPWDLGSDRMPAASLDLYGSRRQLYSYENREITTDQGTVSGIVLTGYYGKAVSLTLPVSLNGTPVIGIGESFLSGSTTVRTLTIGSNVVYIEENAMAAFTGTVVCDAGSAAEAWANARGLNTDVLRYTLTLVSEGEDIDPRRAAKGTALRLPQLTNSYRGFTGWYTDENCNYAVSLDSDGFYIMPGADTTLYAGWDADIEAVPFTWTARSGRVTITGYTGTDNAVVIPATINGWPVTAVAEGAFAGSEVRTIDLGNVLEIGDSAFEDCDALGSVNLPGTLISLGERAFADCDSLKTLNLGSSLAEFDPGQVAGCTRLTAVNAASANPGLFSVDGVLFNKAGTRLILYPQARTAAVYTIPDGVTTVGESAFYRAAALSSVTVPSSVTTLEEGAFQSSGLTAFTASGITTVEADAFFGCTGLESVDCGNALLTIGECAFANCGSLISVHIPETAVLDEDDILFTDSGVTIIGKLGSSAHAYALANGLIFRDPDAVPVTSVTLSQDSAVMKRGESLQLEAVMLPADAEYGTNLYWRSSDESVAMVDEDGLVSAMGGGTATITVFTGNGLYASCTVEVQVDVTSVSFDVPAISVTVGDTVAYLPEIRPYSATDKSLVWTSSDPEIAWAEEDGTIHGESVGEAVLTAAAHNGIQAQLSVKVCVDILEVIEMLHAYDHVRLLPGQQIRLQEPGQPVLVYSTTDGSVLGVSEDGLLTAVSEGTCELQIGITGTDETVVCEVTVSSAGTMELPAALMEVEEEAFLGTAAASVVLGSGVEQVGTRAFADSDVELAVFTGSSVLIADHAFDGSDPLILCGKGSAVESYAQTNGLRYAYIE